MDVSIITVTYNSAKHIAEQIRSVISSCAGLTVEQFVVDNASADATVEIVQKQFPHVKCIKNTNAGFGISNNLAAKESTGEFLLFLNPDMRCHEHIKPMIEWMRSRPDVAIAGCRLVNEKGNMTATPRRFPTIWNQLLVLSKLPHVFPWLLKKYMMSDVDFTKEQEVDSVQGSFFLMRRRFYEERGYAFDPRFFLWFEDVDACRDARERGWKVVYTPIVSCVDIGGQSFKLKNVFWKQKQFVVSMVKYFLKWGL